MLKVSEGVRSPASEIFFNLFQSLAAENWKERRPKEVFALGMTSEIYHLDCVLWMGVAMVTS